MQVSPSNVAARITTEGDGLWPQLASFIGLDGRADEQVEAAGFDCERSEGGEEARRRSYFDSIHLPAPRRPHGLSDSPFVVVHGESQVGISKISFEI